MFRRTRYQDGNIVRVKRSRVPDYWALRWWETDSRGKRIRRNTIIGLVTEYPTEASARKAAESLRMTINEASPPVDQRPISVSALIEHYSNMNFVLETTKRRNPMQPSVPIKTFCGSISNRSGALSSFAKSDR